MDTERAVKMHKLAELTWRWFNEELGDDCDFIEHINSLVPDDIKPPSNAAGYGDVEGDDWNWSIEQDEAYGAEFNKHWHMEAAKLLTAMTRIAIEKAEQEANSRAKTN